MSIHSIISAAAPFWGPQTGSADKAQETYVPHPENERRHALNKRRKSIKAKKAAGKARRRNRKW